MVGCCGDGGVTTEMLVVCCDGKEDRVVTCK